MQIVVIVLAEDAEAAQVLCSSLSSDAWGRKMQAHGCAPAAAPGLFIELAPDVVLIEPSVLARGLSALSESMQVRSGTRVLLRCASATPEEILAAVHWGACGCLRPDDTAATVARAIRRVSEGDVWFRRVDLLAALQRGKQHEDGNGPSDVTTRSSRFQESVNGEGLTPREKQVLDLIGTGLSNKEIARALEISDNTVKTHLHRVYVKLKQSGRYKALLYKTANENRSGNGNGSASRAGRPHTSR